MILLLSIQFHGFREKAAAQGIRTKPEKEAIADGWLHLAASCAKTVVKYEADSQEQQQAQQTIETGVVLC